MPAIQPRLGTNPDDNAVKNAQRDADQSARNGQYDNAELLQKQIEQQTANMKTNFQLDQATALKSMQSKVQL